MSTDEEDHTKVIETAKAMTETAMAMGSSSGQCVACTVAWHVAGMLKILCVSQDISEAKAMDMVWSIMQEEMDVESRPIH